CPCPIRTCWNSWLRSTCSSLQSLLCLPCCGWRSRLHPSSLCSSTASSVWGLRCCWIRSSESLALTPHHC
ncbi:unnamed protein product, partial [Polarella glacialis]